MAPKNLIAEVQTTIEAPIDKVWAAIVDPATIKEYMFGTTVISDWKEGSKIVWKGEWKDPRIIMRLSRKKNIQNTIE